MPPDTTRAILGDNAIRVFGLDAAELTRVAAAIGAPSIAELTRPIDAVPVGASPTAFRTFGPWN